MFVLGFMLLVLLGCCHAMPNNSKKDRLETTEPPNVLSPKPRKPEYVYYETLDVGKEFSMEEITEDDLPYLHQQQQQQQQQKYEQQQQQHEQQQKQHEQQQKQQQQKQKQHEQQQLQQNKQHEQNILDDKSASKAPQRSSQDIGAHEPAKEVHANKYKQGEFG